MATKYGTSGNETLTGSSLADIIYAGDGDNTVNSGAGDDVVFGGDGKDFIQAGAGNDLIYSGAGDDLLSGGEGDDIIVAGAGNDTISGDAGDDIISGGSGDDVFQFKAGFGHDTITDFGDGHDKINIYAGAAGNAKTIQIFALSDFTTNPALAAIVANTEHLQNGAVKYTFLSGDSLTFLNAEAPTGNGNASGSSQADTLLGGTAPSQMVGGAGFDTLLAGSGESHLQGGTGNDQLIGGAADDVINGNAGDDNLFGNGGNDVLVGGAGNDVLAGGDGADTFLFQAGFGNDTVLDLNFSEGDTLSFVGAGSEGSAKITDIQELQDLVNSTGAAVTHTGDLYTIDFHDGNSLKIMGLDGTLT